MQSNPAVPHDLQRTADGKAFLQADGGPGREEGSRLRGRVHLALQGRNLSDISNVNNLFWQGYTVSVGNCYPLSRDGCTRSC
jgi:hypothetical protein